MSSKILGIRDRTKNFDPSDLEIGHIFPIVLSYIPNASPYISHGLLTVGVDAVRPSLLPLTGAHCCHPSLSPVAVISCCRCCHRLSLPVCHGCRWRCHWCYNYPPLTIIRMTTINQYMYLWLLIINLTKKALFWVSASWFICSLQHR